MTTYPLVWPTQTGLTGAKIRRNKVTSASTSPHTGTQQVYGLPGDWWECDVTFPLMVRGDADPWIGWLLSLDGQLGTCLIPPLNGHTPKGSAAGTPGTPVVAGINQTGTSLAISGLPHGAAGYLKSGDWFSLGSGFTRRLHRLVTDADSDGSGDSTLQFRPALRESPANGDPVYVANATGRFRLVQGVTEEDIDNALNRTLGTVSFREDL